MNFPPAHVSEEDGEGDGEGHAHLESGTGTKKARRTDGPRPGLR
jgi:hypothetical protein